MNRLFVVYSNGDVVEILYSTVVCGCEECHPEFYQYDGEFLPGFEPPDWSPVNTRKDFGVM